MSGVPSEQEVIEFGSNLERVDRFTNENDLTYTTKYGEERDTIAGALSKAVSGNITVFSTSATYSLMTEWVELNGVIYRPLPSALPISGTFNSNDWLVVQNAVGLQCFTTVGNMKATFSQPGGVNLSIGTCMRTLGFFTVNDGGGASYIVTNDTSNGRDKIDLGGGLTATLIQEGDIVDFAKYGFTGGEDITEYVIDASQYGKQIVIRQDALIGAISNIDKLDLKLDDVEINTPGGVATCLLNIKDLNICGKGSFGKNNPYVDYFYRIAAGNNLNSLTIDGDLLFDGGNKTDTLFWCDAGVESDANITPFVNFKNVEITGFKRSGIELPMNALEVDGSFRVDNAKVHGGQGRCIQFGDNEFGVKNVSITNCPLLGDVSSGGSSETHAIFASGSNIVISNNYCRNVKNAGESGAEGIYTKGAFCSITDNVLLNAGSSADGCICLKGSLWNGLNDDVRQGAWNVVSGNRVTMTDITYDSKGLGIFESNVIVTNNILTDYRPDRATLTYSMSLGLAGSKMVSNAIVQGNQCYGWNTFIGDYGESVKGRSRFGDNIKIKDNTAVNMLGGYGIAFTPRCELGVRSLSFTGNTVTIVDGINQNGEFDGFIYPVGEEITVTGTTANDGTYTVLEVSRYTITITGTFNTQIQNANIRRVETHNLEITGNTLQGCTYGIRNFDNKIRNLKIDNNTFVDCSYAYRFDQTNGIDLLHIGANNTYINLAVKPQYGTPVTNTPVSMGVTTDLTAGGSTSANGTIKFTDQNGEDIYLLFSNGA